MDGFTYSYPSLIFICHYFFSQQNWRAHISLMPWGCHREIHSWTIIFTSLHYRVKKQVYLSSVTLIAESTSVKIICTGQLSSSQCVECHLAVNALIAFKGIWSALQKLSGFHILYMVRVCRLSARGSRIRYVEFSNINKNHHHKNRQQINI